MQGKQFTDPFEAESRIQQMITCDSSGEKAFHSAKMKGHLWRQSTGNDPAQRSTCSSEQSRSSWAFTEAGLADDSESILEVGHEMPGNNEGHAPSF